MILPLFQNLIDVMHEDKVVDFLPILIVMKHLQAFVAVEARILRVSLAAGCHPRGRKRVARPTTHAMRPQHVVHDRVTCAIETIVGRQQSHVREDEKVLAIALMQINVGLAQSNVEIDESSFRHVGLFEVAQLLLFGPFHDRLAVIDRPRSPERKRIDYVSAYF